LEQRAENDGESETHPATSIRIEVIEAFIDSEKNETVDLINEAIQEITSKELKIRFSKPDSEDFFNYLPPVISRESELHGLFIVGWEIWLNNLDRFNEKDSRKKYLYLNNLIEKSISNFMIQKRWEDVCK
jgi:predicted DNA-binding protein